MFSNNTPAMPPAPSTQASLELLDQLENRLQQLRTWEEGHGRLVEQLHAQTRSIAGRHQELDTRAAQLEKQAGQLADESAAVQTQQTRLNAQRTELDTLRQTLNQQQQQIEHDRRQVDEATHQLNVQRTELATEQDRIIRQGTRVAQEQRELENLRRELAGQQEQRRLLLDVKNVLKESEEQMIHRWATGTAVTFVTKLSLTTAWLAVFSFAASQRLEPYDVHWLPGSTVLERTAVMFAVFVTVVGTIGLLLRWLLTRKKRVLDAKTMTALDCLNDTPPTATKPPSLDASG